MGAARVRFANPHHPSLPLTLVVRNDDHDSDASPARHQDIQCGILIRSGNVHPLLKCRTTHRWCRTQVYECMIRGIAVMRRRTDSYVNATQILKVAGIDKGRRTKILEKEILPGKHEIVQGGYGKYQGTWCADAFQCLCSVLNLCSPPGFRWIEDAMSPHSSVSHISSHHFSTTCPQISTLSLLFPPSRLLDHLQDPLVIHLHMWAIILTSNNSNNILHSNNSTQTN